MDSVKSRQISNQDKLSKHIEKWYILKQDIAELEKKIEQNTQVYARTCANNLQ